MTEEFARIGAMSVLNGFTTHTDVVLPYLMELATPEQAKRWLPDLAAGRRIGAIAMSEPGTGSDLQGIRTTARRDGTGDGARGLVHLMERLPRERLSTAVTGCAFARAALGWTIDYVTGRTAFGQRVADFQNTQFTLAELLTEIEVTQAYLEDAVSRLDRGQLSAVDAAKAKWWTSEMHKRVVDRCLQLYGGYGYMEDYPIARAYRDTRVTTIYGGTTEIMKLIIGRDIVGRP
ncbi:MAG: hypothetical protein QOF99_6236 [Pseudonocardiales bacterium]|jgi:alkylation response protein AidB-like acyl-CoA dehydrogenase|nr:hypothetical protein [Pseudonocardiales bacterium]